MRIKLRPDFSTYQMKKYPEVNYTKENKDVLEKMAGRIEEVYSNIIAGADNWL